MKPTSSKIGRAWVLGGSISGLLAARVLSDHCEQVFIVERDATIGEKTPRKGAPQGQHVHAFLPRGVAALERMFPGISKEITEAGATNGDLCGDAQWCPGGHRLARGESSMRVIAATRPFIECFVAGHVLAIPNVELVANTVGIGFRVAEGKMTGIHLRDRDGTERTETADIVVDATGRASRLSKWLIQSGFSPPPEDRIDVNLRYATVRFRRSTAPALNIKAAIVGASSDAPRGGIAQAVEDDVLQVSIAEYSNSPPTDVDAFVEYAKTLPQPDLYDWMQGAEPLEEHARTHRIQSTYRRHFDRARGFPEGLLAIGDAICAFNPVYAQGMTVAAVEAEILGECLAANKPQLSKRFFKAIRGVIGITWQIGSTNDLSLPQVEGKRDIPTRIISSWINRVQLAGTTNASIATKFIRVAALLDPPSSLLNPLFAWQVLRTRS